MGLLVFVLVLAAFAYLVRTQMLLQDQVERLEREVAWLHAEGDAARREREEALGERLRTMAAPELAPEQSEPPQTWTAPVAEDVEEEAEPAVHVHETLANLFERFVAGRLLIWVGGISLAVAGVFLVRYSIEIGLITPPVRMILAAVFGLILLGAGEWARGRAEDPRIAQALVGAGIFVLYAAAYGSLTLYGLIGLGTAAALMALITAAALALSLRHGAPTAVMGLIGGFLTPLLVGDPDASALTLLAYLALLNAALFAVAQRRCWGWLSIAALLLSFAWTAALLADPDAREALAGGVFIVTLALAGSLQRLAAGRASIGAPAIGLVQLAVLVGRQDLGLPAWLLFGALAAASLLLSIRRTDFRLLAPLALLLALLLLGGETVGTADSILPFVAAAITLLFTGFAWPRVAGEDRSLWSFVAGAALAAPVVILRVGEPELLPRWGWALAMVVLSAGTATLAWRQRNVERANPDPALLGAAAGTALLLAIAAYDLLPLDWTPFAWLLLAVAGALAAQKLADQGAAVVSAALAALAALTGAMLVPSLWSTALASLFGEPALASDLPTPSRAILVLVLPGALLMLLGRLLPLPKRSVISAVGAGLLIGGLYVPAKSLFALGDEADFVARGFAERTLFTQALFLTGFLLARRGGWARVGTALTGLAAFRFVWFDLIVHNPAAEAQWVGTLPLLNLLLPAYVGSAAWLYLTRRRGDAFSNAWLALALAALIAGVMLLVRQLFQGAILNGLEVPRGEFYGYSLAGLLLSVALLLGGIRLPDKALRLAGLALLTATVFKVFLIDAAALEGVLRILSFLGLGIALIGVGKLYGRILNAEAPAAA